MSLNRFSGTVAILILIFGQSASLHAKKGGGVEEARICLTLVSECHAERCVIRNSDIERGGTLNLCRCVYFFYSLIFIEKTIA